MSNLDRRVVRLEQVTDARDIKDIAFMTPEERDQLMIEILSRTWVRRGHARTFTA